MREGRGIAPNAWFIRYVIRVLQEVKKPAYVPNKVKIGYQEPEVIGGTFFDWRKHLNGGKGSLGVPQGHYVDIYGDI